MPYEITDGDVKWAVFTATKAAKYLKHLADEFESEALVTLAWAAARFDPEKGVKFRTWAAGRIRGAMLDLRRKWGAGANTRTRRGRPLPTVHSVDAVGSDGKPLTDEVESRDDPVGYDLEYRDEVRGLARRLPRGHQAAFIAFHTSHPTMRQAGESVGLSESRVSQILTQSHFILHNQFSSPGRTRNMTNGTADPRAAELFRRKKLLTSNPYTPPPAKGDGVRCGACGGSIARNDVCRRCYPKLAATPPREKFEAQVSHPGRTAPEDVVLPPNRDKDCFHCGDPITAADGRCQCRPAVKPSPVIPAAPAPPSQRFRPEKMVRCSRCDGRLNTFNGRCPRCPAEVPPTRADVRPVEVEVERKPEPVVEVEVDAPEPVSVPADKFKDGRRLPIDYPVEVKAAVESLQARGVYPSGKAVMKELGGGDPSKTADMIKALVASGEVVITTTPATRPGGFAPPESWVDYPVEVKSAVDAVLARGEYPSVDRVRKEMGRGSNDTIGAMIRSLIAAGEVTVANRPTYTPATATAAPVMSEPAPVMPEPAPVMPDLVRVFPDRMPFFYERPAPVTADAAVAADPELALIGAFLNLSPDARDRVVTYLIARGQESLS